MSVRWMRPGDTLGTGEGAMIVCLVADAVAPAANRAALADLARVTPAEAALVLLGADRAGDGVLDAAHDLGREVAAIERGAGDSLGELLSRACGAAGRGDLVLVSARCRLPGGWLQRLRAAALSDDLVATATPIGDGGGAVGVPDGGCSEPDRVIAAAAIRARPRLLIGGPHCVYMRRAAIELVGGLPGGHRSLGSAIAAFCERCVAAGMVSVLADDLYVPCGPEADDSADLPAAALRHLDRSDDRSPLHRSLALAASVLTGLSVTIDGRALVSTVAGGTQRYTRELVLALARTDAAVRVVVAHDVAASFVAELGDTDGVEVITYEQAVAGVALTHVVHRPQQIFSTGDLNLLALLGRRVVITHQDLIGYHNPTYHETFESWEQYRRMTRIALAAADRVLFLSEHGRRDAQAEDLIGSDRCEVIGAALAEEPAVDPERPPGAPPPDDFILCLGPDYRHKNRRFAIAVAGALRAQHGWPGQLVLAGAHVAHGSSRAQEAQLLAADGELRRAVVDLGAVDGPGRAWLLRHARAIIVPSVVEGFGLVPLEAAQAGIPCLFAAQSSLPEVIDGSLATLVAWDANASARNVIPLLGDGSPRRAHVQRLRATSARWSWDTIAGQLVRAYEHALRMPHRAASARAWQESERERYLEEVLRDRRAYQQRLRALGDGVALGGRDGFLTDRQQRGLMRVGGRPALARLTLWPFGLLGSIRTRPRAPEAAEPTP